MGNMIDTQMMVHRSTEYTKDNSIQLHRTDVSQETFTREMKLRAQMEMQKPVAVENADGDIIIREDRENKQPAQERQPQKKPKAPRKSEGGGAPAKDAAASRIDIRI